jgi:hypothetical protein
MMEQHSVQLLSVFYADKAQIGDTIQYTISKFTYLNFYIDSYWLYLMNFIQKLCSILTKMCEPSLAVRLLSLGCR